MDFKWYYELQFKMQPTIQAGILRPTGHPMKSGPMTEAGIKGRDKQLPPTDSVWRNYLYLLWIHVSGTQVLKDAHGVFYIIVSFWLDICWIYPHLSGFFTGTEVILLLIQWEWSNPKEYG